MNIQYRRLAPDTLAVSLPLDNLGPDTQWGKPRLTRIFNFTARQVTTIYERGGLQEYDIPNGSYNTRKAYSAALTSALQIHSFHELPNPDEIRQMHEKLTSLRGNPPPLDDVLEKIPAKNRTSGLARPK